MYFSFIYHAKNEVQFGTPRSALRKWFAIVSWSTCQIQRRTRIIRILRVRHISFSSCFRHFCKLTSNELYCSIILDLDQPLHLTPEITFLRRMLIFVHNTVPVQSISFDDSTILRNVFLHPAIRMKIYGKGNYSFRSKTMQRNNYLNPLQNDTVKRYSLFRVSRETGSIHGE